MAPIASRRELLRSLARLNTAPEAETAQDVLYGPGLRIELAPGQDPVTQMLVTINEEEIGWPMLLRLASHLQWKLVDPSSGRELLLNSDAERRNG